VSFAEVVCRTAFSFHEGASSPEEIVTRAAALGLEAVAITDRDGVYALPRAHKAARACGIRVLPGALLSIADGPGLALLARTLQGWSGLCRLITEARTDMDKGWGEIPLEQVCAQAEGLEAVLLGDWSTQATLAVREAFGDHVSLALRHTQDSHDKAQVEAREALAMQTGVPLVATGDVLIHSPERQPLQDVLTCIRRHCTIDQAGTSLQPNAARYLRSPAQMQRLFKDHPAAYERSVEIARRCAFSLDQLAYRYPREIVPEGMSPMGWLRHETEAGLRWRYPAGVPPQVRDQVAHELDLIARMNFPAYFLTVYDVVRFARERKILCQGRGSAANSAVCFALGITAVDPATSSLLFERFISEERGEPPDIDVDFEHERREEVLQYVYERYGRHRAAMVNEVIRYRRRSAIRDVGKVMGLDADQIDRLAKGVHWFDLGEVTAAHLREAGLNPEDPRVRLTLDLSTQIQGLPRHVGIHTGGFTISDGPLLDLCPIEPATMDKRTVIQWDKDDIDTVGFVKVDLLSLGMLTATRKCFEMVEAHWNRPLSLATVPSEDPAVYEMLCKADTVGLFQVESRAQMSMLPRLQPRCFYDLVVQVSIVRPGPIQGGMVHPYLRRRRGEEPVTYPHPDLEPILARTLGVPIFQEQVMAMAVAVGGFTPGQADALRRAMGAWRKRGGLTEIVEGLMAGMQKRGITPEYAQQICEQIKGFGEYGFPESHAASFARLVYVSAWLKCHYPAAFTAALLNSQPMGFYSPRSLVDDARRHGVEVRPVDVQQSQWESTLEPSTAGPGSPHPLAIRLGLGRIKGLAEAAGQRVVTARGEDTFIGIGDLQRRADLDRGALAALARADALCTLATDRRQAMWQVQGLYDLPLFRGLLRDEPPAPLPPPSPMDELQADYQHLGLSLTHNPIAMVRDQLDREGVLCAEAALGCANKRTIQVAGMVSHRQRPSTASGVVFMTMEDETGMLNIVIKPALFEQQRQIILDNNLLRVTAQVQRDGDSVSLLARRFSPLEVPASVHPQSRDFR
jgi:error-prone DNA polymerase